VQYSAKTSIKLYAQDPENTRAYGMFLVSLGMRIYANAFGTGPWRSSKHSV
jgi:hypothetical protein